MLMACTPTTTWWSRGRFSTRRRRMRVTDLGGLRQDVPAGRAPQRVAEADHRDAVRVGQQAVEGVRHHGERGADDPTDREEHGRPPGQNACRYSAMPKTRPPAR